MQPLRKALTIPQQSAMSISVEDFLQLSMLPCFFAVILKVKSPLKRLLFAE